MAKRIIASIDLSLIDKNKIKEVKLKSGKTARFYDIEIYLKDEKDQYGNDVSVSIGQTKEEREQKVTKVYLGNGKTVWQSDSVQAQQEVKNDTLEDDSLPF
jgi:YbbR domain-containing protein